jgi:ERCC4-type nuclease
MVLVDQRTGSIELVPFLEREGLTARITSLQFGDFAFDGRGPGERLIAVGIERKRIRDLLNSIRNGRFAGHQSIGLRSCYECIFLIVEGILRPHPQSGLLEELRGRSWVVCSEGQESWTYRALEAFLTTQELMAGIHVRRTRDEAETAAMVAHLPPLVPI